MRAPIGFRISNRRKSLKISQAALARQIGISPSYLNLIENNKRDIGGALLNRVATALYVDIDELAGRAEQKILQDLEEAYADPMLESLPFQPDERRQLVAQYPASAAALARLHRAYSTAMANADAYADRLRSDPLLGELLHQILSGVTAIRSSAEILAYVPDLDDAERQQFLNAINRESEALTDVSRNLIGQFETSSKTENTISPAREIDDFIIERHNHFPLLETVADSLRAEIETEGHFGVSALTNVLRKRFGIGIVVGGQPPTANFAGQYRYDLASQTIWFHGASTVATRQFQLARLYGELAASSVMAEILSYARLTSETSKRLASRALGAYLAGAVVFPYSPFLEDAEACAYDIDHLRQSYNASFEQVAHRFVTLRREGEEGIPFGFLRSDPAGRLTKHFPLPGLLLPNSGHACPLWTIYSAFRLPETTQRQVVRFSDGSRYLFIARTVQYRAVAFGNQPVPSSVMLACDVLHADQTIYGRGLDLSDNSVDTPVGPSCRLCTRQDCASRQEASLSPSGMQVTMRIPFVANDFGLGG
jgi:predicted transcriptional regulator/DNA-binding XRE family transcriptional regulator